MINLLILAIIALTTGFGINMKNRLKLLWFRLLGKNHNQNSEHEIQFGDLTVGSKGESRVELHCPPKRINVKFIGFPHHVPCDPHHDKLSWDIIKIHGKHMLIIKWHVSGIREIKWMIFY